MCCCISLGQRCPFGGSTRAPRHCLGALNLLEQRENGLVKSNMGFLRDSRIRPQSFINDSPPSIRSVSRIVEGRLAKTRQRRTFAMSLKTSRKLRPSAKFKIVVTALNHSLRLWLTFPAFSKRIRVRMKRAMRPRVRKMRRAWLLKRCHVWRLGLKSADSEESGELFISGQCGRFGVGSSHFDNLSLADQNCWRKPGSAASSDCRSPWWMCAEHIKDEERE